MRVAVTGATGAIGRSLLDHLAAGSDWPLTGLTRSLPPCDLPCDPCGDRIRWIQGDLGSPSDCEALVREQDAIIHLAHTNVPLSSDRDMSSDTLLNLVPTLNLLKAVQAAGHRPHLVYASSGGAVYGRSADRVPFTEDHPCLPVNSYGIQKLAAEHYIRLCAERGYLTATVLRISNAYGWLLSPARNQGFIGIALYQALKGRPVRILGDMENVRDYIHIEDLCAAVRACLEPQRPYDLFNIGTGVGVSVQGVLDVIQRCLGRRLERVAEAHPAAAFLPDWCVLDVSKARRELGWNPAIDLREGVRKMLAARSTCGEPARMG